MSRTAKKKTFDCIAFKRRAQRALLEETRGMTDEERRAHIRRMIEAGPLAAFWNKLKQHARTAPKAGRL